MGVEAEMTMSISNQGDPQVAPNGSFTKSVIHPGSGLVRPNEGSMCIVEISQSGDLESLNEALIGYQLGDEIIICLGDGEGVMSEMIDTCLEMMLPGEICKMKVAVETIREIIQKMQNTNNVNSSLCESLMQQSVVFQIELKSFTRGKDIHEMSIEEKLDRAFKYKTIGSNCFSRGKLDQAEMFYLRALRYIITIDPLEIADASNVKKVQLNTLKCACMLNVAACKLKYKRYEHVISHCTKVLALDNGSIKGFFRRGIAYMELQEYEKAKADFDHALRLEPTSKTVKQQRQILQERMKSLDAKYARAMSKMFGGQ